MALQTTAADLILQKFRSKDYEQYNRSHRYAKYVGKDPFSIIQREDSLMESGEFVNIAFTDALPESNIGEGTLEGAEGTFAQRKTTLKPYWHRNAVKISKAEAKLAFTDQYAIQRRELRRWKENHVYSRVVDAFNAIVPYDAGGAAAFERGDGTNPAHPQQLTYEEASEAQRDAYVTANARRLNFGGDTTNLVADDMSASLATIVAADVMSPAFIQSMKRQARSDTWATNGKLPMRPLSGSTNAENGREFFKMWVGPQSFEALGNNEDMKSYNTDARVRGVEDNPIFQDGDLLYKGVIICEEPRIVPLAGVGAAGIDVEPVWFCGAQSLGWAMGQKYKYTKSDSTDYQFLRGVGVEEQYSIEKLFDGAEQRGMITGYAAAVG